MSTKEKYSKRRKEIWIHPDGGKRSHRTTSTTEPSQDIEEEELSKLSQSEVNVFIIYIWFQWCCPKMVYGIKSLNIQKIGN